MSKHLVIVESPAKAKKIERFLGKDYAVKASVGHVRDLPEKRLGVKIDAGFEPEYVATTRGKKVLKELKTAAKKCDRIFLAPDPDREGEAIAWHLFEALKDVVPEDRFYRVTYNEITKSAILDAFAHPEKIDMNRVNAQQARRVLDRLVGFKGSPVVRRQIRGAQSVGRVQTVALRLVVEREAAIENFRPESYFAVGATARKRMAPVEPFGLKLARIDGEPVGVKERKLLTGAIRTPERMEELLKDLANGETKVSDVFVRETTRRARPPFITSSLQQAASGRLGYSPARTMGIAQKLYENGLITYMRTDSFNVAQSAREECRRFVETAYGAEYLPEKPNFYKSKGGAQEAHEAIRPTDVAVQPDRAEGLETAERKLYKLIWERFVASQMAPARIARRTAEIRAGRAFDCLFRAVASEIVFPGYMRASGIEAAGERAGNGNGEEAETDRLPPLEKGEVLDVLEWLSERKETKPLPRYTEASLIRALEENGVGRPSTYAAIMSKLDEREYVSKQGRALVPTARGRELIDLVLKTEAKLKTDNKIDLFEPGFTADMEARLDRIEEGQADWSEMMESFYPSLLEWIEHAKEIADPDLVRGCLEALGHVREWAEPVKSGRRTYDDRKTFEELKDDVEGGKKLSARQGEMLRKMCCRYIDRIPGDLAKALELEAPEAVRSDTPRKLEILSGVKAEEPRKVGKRTYDDAKFVRSLADQIRTGKRLSERQLAYLDSLLVKYAEQIENFDALKAEFKLDAPKPVEADPAIAPLLDAMGRVTEWAKPVKRGKRVFDDKVFLESLAGQFKAKGSLSERQVAALKRMVVKYADQLPDFETLRETCGLPEPKKRARA